jgi:hypothetical protein
VTKTKGRWIPLSNDHEEGKNYIPASWQGNEGGVRNWATIHSGPNMQIRYGP